MRDIPILIILVLVIIGAAALFWWDVMAPRKRRRLAREERRLKHLFGDIRRRAFVGSIGPVDVAADVCHC